MSNPRAYLEASLTRLAGRGNLARRDVEMMVEGLLDKNRFLEELPARIRQHRREDVSQLRDAREQTWIQWNERLKRLEEWVGAAAGLGRSSEKAYSWQNSTAGFHRAQQIGERFGPALESKAVKLEKRLLQLAESLRQWSDRLMLKESDLRGFLDRETAKGVEVLISSARKRPLLDFVYAERDEEARLARGFKEIRGASNHVLARFTRAEQWAAQRALANPAYFEIQKDAVLSTWSAVQKHFQQIREETLNQALIFEDGRRRLRWIYDTVQRMRVVQSTSDGQRPLLDRFFKSPDTL